MSVSIHSSHTVKRGAAVVLLRAYLADFLAHTPAMTGNHGLISPWSDGLLDLALQAVRAGDLPRAADGLAQASALAAEPVPEPQAQQERERIALAVSVACALLALAAGFSPANSASKTPVRRHRAPKAQG
jgi:hypothetical protein